MKTYTYEAKQFDAVTWAVKRTDEEGLQTECVLRDVPAGTTEKQVVDLAIKDGSWA